MASDPTPALDAPSLLDPRATGGIHAGVGFDVQERYVAIRIPGWLADPAFTRLQPERSEDVDVWFDDGGHRDHHQVKNETLTPSKIEKLVREFRDRNAALIESGVIRKFVIACRYLNEDLRGFAEKIRIHRKRHFGGAEKIEQEASIATLRQRAKTLGLVDHFDFVVAHVEFDEDLVGLSRDDGHPRDLLAINLTRLSGIASNCEALHVADALLTGLHQDRVRAWSRGELEELLRNTREEYRGEPARPLGDLVMICHQTLKRVVAQPGTADLPELAEGRRLRIVEIDATTTMAEKTLSAIESVAAALVAPVGTFRRALQDEAARVVYYGFPHVPFGVLAGFIAQPHRSIALVEHDLDSASFRWRPSEPVSGMTIAVSRYTGGSCARLRVSMSARVREEHCVAVLPADTVRLDINAEAENLGRGIVGTEAQARHFATVLRRALDAEIAGNNEIKELHVFAAVPVSVAFLVGQLLAHSSMPAAHVYNFDTSDTPPYRWSLSLHAAAAGTPCVRISKEPA